MTKAVIAKSKFNKQVEIESAYLVYIDRLPKEIADKKALETVSKKYQLEKE